MYIHVVQKILLRVLEQYVNTSVAVLQCIYLEHEHVCVGVAP